MLTHNGLMLTTTIWRHAHAAVARSCPTLLWPPHTCRVRFAMVSLRDGAMEDRSVPPVRPPCDAVWCQDVMSTAVVHMYATSTRHRSISHAQPSPRTSDLYTCALGDGGHHLRCTTSSRPPLDAARRDVVRTPALECMHAAATWHPIKSPSRLPPRPLGSRRRLLRDGGTRVYCVPLSPPPLDAAVLEVTIVR